MTTRDGDMEDYFRPDPGVSRAGDALLHRYGRGRSYGPVLAVAAVLFASAALAQYPGRIVSAGKSASTLRSVAVLEWTGDAASPSAGRLIPVTVYDGEQLNDGSVYLNRPEPLALANGTEYELQAGGKAMRLFDLAGASKVAGAWYGVGVVRALSAEDASKADSNANANAAADSANLSDDGKGVLKRKSESVSSADGAAADGADGKASSGAKDADRPTLRGAGQSNDAEMAESSRAAADPDRPHLRRGNAASLGRAETPRLDGAPAALQQAVAVSDAARRAEHVWKHTWANSGDEQKLKKALEEIAGAALGLDTPSSQSSTGKDQPPSRKKNSMLPAGSSGGIAPETSALADESFRVFELAYGATATLVLTAASPGGPANGSPGGGPKKFVILIAQPDLYGGIRVLYQGVTDEAHLDETPRMRLIDAVDAMGDNHAELLFELRGSGQRQFALYRVQGGLFEQLFATTPLP